jgi:hypothetical protein
MGITPGGGIYELGLQRAVDAVYKLETFVGFVGQDVCEIHMTPNDLSH